MIIKVQVCTLFLLTVKFLYIDIQEHFLEHVRVTISTRMQDFYQYVQVHGTELFSMYRHRVARF